MKTNLIMFIIIIFFGTVSALGLLLAVYKVMLMAQGGI